MNVHSSHPTQAPLFNCWELAAFDETVLCSDIYTHALNTALANIYIFGHGLLGEAIIAPRKIAFCYSLKALDLKIEEGLVPCSSSLTFQLIKKELSKSNRFLLGLDAFDLPWSPAHNSHSQKHFIRVLDVEESGRLLIEDLFHRSDPFFVDAEFLLKNAYMWQTVSSENENLSRFESLDVFNACAEMPTDSSSKFIELILSLDHRQEVAIYRQPWQSPIARKLKQYHEISSLLKQRHDDLMEHGLSSIYRDLSDSWIRVWQLTTGSKNGEQFSRVSSLLERTLLNIQKKNSVLSETKTAKTTKHSNHSNSKKWVLKEKKSDLLTSRIVPFTSGLNAIVDSVSPLDSSLFEFPVLECFILGIEPEIDDFCEKPSIGGETATASVFAVPLEFFSSPRWQEIAANAVPASGILFQKLASFDCADQGISFEGSCPKKGGLFLVKCPTALLLNRIEQVVEEYGGKNLLVLEEIAQ